MNKFNFQEFPVLWGRKTYMKINTLWVNCTEQRILPSVSGGMWVLGRVSGRKGVCWVRGTVSVEEWSEGEKVRWRGGLSGKSSCATREFGLHCGYCPTPKLREGTDQSLPPDLSATKHWRYVGTFKSNFPCAQLVFRWQCHHLPQRSSQVQASGPFFHRVELVCNKRK